ncbi:hypothetical protein [Candidatus Nitrospira bockiana]
MNPVYIVAQEGVARLWEPTKRGLDHPSHAYVEQMREFFALFNIQIVEDRKQAYEHHLGLIVAGVTGLAGQDLSFSRRGLFKLLGLGVAGLSMAHLLRVDEALAAFNTRGGGIDTTVYPIIGATGGWAPANGATFYHGMATSLQSTGGFKICRQILPAGGTMTAAYWSNYIGTNAGSAETVTHSITINNTTDVGSATVAFNPGATNHANTSATGLSQAISAGDDVMVKQVCPTWSGTLPGSVRSHGAIKLTVS